MGQEFFELTDSNRWPGLRAAMLGLTHVSGLEGDRRQTSPLCVRIAVGPGACGCAPLQTGCARHGSWRRVRPGGRGLITAIGQGSCARIPRAVAPAVQRASLHRWTGMLAVAAQRALACSLLELPLAAADECDGTEPPLGDLLADARDTEPVHASRSPAPC